MHSIKKSTTRNKDKIKKEANFTASVAASHYLVSLGTTEEDPLRPPLYLPVFGNRPFSTNASWQHKRNSEQQFTMITTNNGNSNSSVRSRFLFSDLVSLQLCFSPKCSVPQFFSSTGCMVCFMVNHNALINNTNNIVPPKTKPHCEKGKQIFVCID